MSPLSDRPGGCVLRARVVPRAGRTAVAGERGGALLVRLAAAPVEGEANLALVAWLAERLGVPRRAIRLVSGERHRDKKLEIDGMTAAAAASKLGLPA